MAVCAFVLWSGATRSQSGEVDVFAHPGIVEDRVTGKPIRADVHAYASEKGRSISGACTYYEESVHATQSDFSGRFTLKVDRKLHSYVVSYCNNDYIPRSETTNSNEVDGAPVEGNPVTLFPNNVEEKAYVAALRSELTRTASELRYMSSAKPEYYRSALQELRADSSFVADSLRQALLGSADRNASPQVSQPPVPPSSIRIH
jgi:hypothetical protein